MTTTYDRDTLYSRLQDIADLAGELRYIDAVLGFIASETEPDVYSWTSQFAINDIGRTFPFSRVITKQHSTPGYEDTISSFLESAAEDAQNWQRTNYESLLQLIEPVTHPDTSYYDEIVTSLITAYSILSVDPDDGVLPPEDTGAARRVDFGMMDPDAWRGHAASNFRNYFYMPFKNEVRGYQAMYTKAIAAGFTRAKAIDDLAQISLLDGANATRRALREQLEFRQQDRGGGSTADALIIAGVGTSILASISASVPPVSVTMSVISGLLNYAASEEAAVEARNEDGFVGRSADDLFFGFFDQAGRIASRRRGHYDSLDNDMSTLLEWGEINHRENALIPTRPDIAERGHDGSFDPDLDEFRNRYY